MNFWVIASGVTAGNNPKIQSFSPYDELVPMLKKFSLTGWEGCSRILLAS
jgi:hypothetical protein